MHIITTTEDLSQTCQRFAEHDFVTVDTEFMRESTFWPILCLIQLASPDEAVIIDPMAEGIDIAPFMELMADSNVTKVFHAARQDIEIIYNLGSIIPEPLFDTQIAAMVCGHGDSIAYSQIVSRLTGGTIDKSSRFTDWARRPLTEKQLEYALADVTYLRDVYLSLKAELEKRNRLAWVAEEMDILRDPETYDLPLKDAWTRLKMRVRKPVDLAVLQAVAAWREEAARSRDVPRRRVLKDDALYEIAQQHPLDEKALSRLRAIPKGFEKSRMCEGLIEAVEQALQIPKEHLPQIPRPRHSPQGTSAASELLKVLLKLISEREDVACKVIANGDDLDRIAAGEREGVPALEGWRRELFGDQALELLQGDIALGFEKKSIQIIELE